MIVCEKEFTVSVNQPMSIPTAGLYWKMEEASGNRIDAIHSLPWNTTPGWPTTGPYAPPAVIYSAPGIVGNGAHFTQVWQPIIQRLDTAGSNPNGTSLLAFNGFFDVCFWIKFTVFGVFYVEDDTTVGCAGEVHLSYDLTNFPSEGSTQQALFFTGDFNSDGKVDHYQRISFGSDGTLDFEPVLDTWYFVRWFYTRTTHQFGLQINNGAIHLSPTPLVIASYTRGFLRLQQTPNNGLAPDFGFPTAVAEQFIADEVPFFNNLGRNLTAAEMNYIYNSGAGRTYPFT